MPLISPALPADGDDAIVEPYNTAITAVLGVLNGHVDQDNIADASVTVSKFAPGAVAAALNASTVPADWTTLATVPTYVSNPGNKFFNIQFAGVDYTDRLQAGTKLRIPRSVTPPTQSMAFIAASSQYASKSSPAGLTFTGAWTAEAWIYLNGLTGTNQAIISRDNNSATGWSFDVTTIGTLQSLYRDGTNTTVTNTYQSIPLNQWTHVAVVVVPSTKTFTFYINGVAVTAIAASGTATAVSQGTNSLMIGAKNSGTPTQFFNGYISEAHVWSIAQTQSVIQANMGINLVGTETSLVSLFKGNGNFTDTTSNANTLTASGAVATQVANPYNPIEYGSIISAVFSSSNTNVLIDTGNMNTIPNAMFGTVSYSSVGSPFGMPGNLKTYSRYVQIGNKFSTSNTTPIQVPGLGTSLTIPAGGEKYLIEGYAEATSDTSASVGIFITLWDGVVGSSNQIGLLELDQNTASFQVGGTAKAYITPSVGARTINVGFHVTGGTGTFGQASTLSAIQGFLMVRKLP